MSTLPLEGIFEATQSKPASTFPAILADPPWDILQRGSKGASEHYPLMTVDEIAALPVGDLASTSAHLWLWVTNGTLFAGKHVMEAWGVTYRSTLKGGRFFRAPSWPSTWSGWDGTPTF